MRVLLIEDETKVRNFIQKGLRSAEFLVDATSNLEEAFSSMMTVSYDVIVLDRLLKGIDSIKYLPEFRQKSPSTKILILSALSDVQDKVDGLTEGADDYLAKPFHLSELVARLRALSRRKEQETPNHLQLDNLIVKLDSQRVQREDQKINLTAKEYKLLVFLMRRPNRIYSKYELLNDVWELDHFPESNVVEVAINHLRSKIDKGFDKPLLHSKRGAGYWVGDPDL